MSQPANWSVPLVSPATPSTMASRMDASFNALLSMHKGAARPAYAVAGTTWVSDAVANISTIYYYDGNTDIPVARINTSSHLRRVAEEPFIDIASAATTDIGSKDSQNVRITGNTTITSLGTADIGTVRLVRMAASLILTHNATSLILPGAVSIITAANDCFIAISLGSGNWLVAIYQPSAGRIGDLIASGSASAVATLDFVLPTAPKSFKIMLRNIEPVSSGVSLAARAATDGVPNYISTSVYRSAGVGIDDAASSYAIGSGGLATSMALSFNQASSAGWGSFFDIDLNPGATSRTLMMNGVGAYMNSSGRLVSQLPANVLASAGVRATHIRFFFTSGNIATCDYELYGFRG